MKELLQSSAKSKDQQEQTEMQLTSLRNEIKQKVCSFNLLWQRIVTVMN